MKVDFNKKYTTISVYVIITFAVCLFLVILLLNSSTLFGYIKQIFKVLAPVTWGIVIAYLINPLMKSIERSIKKAIEKKKPHPKIARILSLTLSMLIFIALLVALISIILPQVIESILGIFGNINEYINNLENFVFKFLDDYPDIVETVRQQFDVIQPKLLDFVNDMMPKLGDWAIKLKDGAIGFIVALKDFVIGFIVAVYLLLSKEKFLAQSRKATHALFSKNVSANILRISAHTNKTLGGFLTGKIIDSLIIGMLCFICMTLMKMEFVALISVVVGVTNIIPFFGPFIGAIPSALLLLVEAPNQVIPFLIFILILQQFDGNILGPMILGDSTGLSAFWVMVAIFLGGGLFGFAGMILGVPLFAVVYELIGEFISYLLKKKNMSDETADYITFDNDSGATIIKNKNISKNMKNIFKKNKANEDENDTSSKSKVDDINKK